MLSSLLFCEKAIAIGNSPPQFPGDLYSIVELATPWQHHVTWRGAWCKDSPAWSIMDSSNKVQIRKQTFWMSVKERID